MIKDDILDNIFTIYNQKKVFIPTQFGLVNKEMLAHEQTNFIKDSVRHLNDDLVLTNYDSVSNDGLKFNLELDFVVMKRKDFEEVLNLLEDYESKER